MNDIEAAEGAFAEACRVREEAYRAVRVHVASHSDAGALEGAFARLDEATARARDAKRHLGEARALAELAAPPGEYAPADPVTEAVWLDRLREEWSEAARRVDSIRQELDAVPGVDLAPLRDPGLPTIERDRLFDASEARSARVIPLLRALEVAEKDYEAINAALDRIEGSPLTD